MASFQARFLESDSGFNANFGEVYQVGIGKYADLPDKPLIEGVTLVGDKTFRQLGLDTLTVQDVEKILYLD